MASKPLPLPVFDRKAGRLIEEFMDDAPSTYESAPRRSLNQWLESHPLYDWLLRSSRNTGFLGKKTHLSFGIHAITLREFEPGPNRRSADSSERLYAPSLGTVRTERGGIESFA